MFSEAVAARTDSFNANRQKVYTFSYTGASEAITLGAGRYRFEVWGASGGQNTRGLGGYAIADTSLAASLNLSVYVGGQGLVDGGVTRCVKPGGWNGGGATTSVSEAGNCSSGGGATDIRLIGGNWDDLNSLRSRIIVGGGGGAGPAGNTISLGHGGGLIGGTGHIANYSAATGGTQTAGGSGLYYAVNGQFGIGASGSRAGGGGGWYGGAVNGGPAGNEVCGGGGSGYIKGCPGCDTTYLANQGSITFTNMSMQNGVRTGDGLAVITDLNVVPAIAITNLNTTWRSSSGNGTKTMTISGTVTDPDSSQSLVISYQIDSTTGTWTNLITSGLNTPLANAGYSQSITLPNNLTNGAHTLYLRVYDGRHYSTQIADVSTTFNIDNTNPNLSISNSSNTWYNSQRSTTISASDSNSGLAGVRYSFTTSNPFTSLSTCQSAGTATSNGATINTPVGNQTLYLCAYDNAGNYITTSGTFNWESTPPTCTTWTPVAASVSWKNSTTSPLTQSFTLSGCTDTGGSNLSSTNTYTCTTGSNHNDTCQLTVKDNAGNQIVYTSPGNKVDTLAPTIETSLSSNDWFNYQRQPVITLFDPQATATSAQSGLKRAAYVWSTPALPVTNPTATLGADCSLGTAVTNGQTLTSTPMGGATLYLCAIDNAGNITFNQGTYNWDNSTPIINQTPEFPPDGANQIYLTNPTITLSASSPLPTIGISGIRFSWDMPFTKTQEVNPVDPTTFYLAWQNNNQTTTIPTAGAHTLYYQAKDNAGNLSEVNQVVYKLNSTPNTTLTFTNPGVMGTNSWYVTAPIIQVNGTDVTNDLPTNENIIGLTIDWRGGPYDSSFMPTTYYDLSSADANHKYVANLTPPTDGVYTLYYFATNISSATSRLAYTTLRVDTTQPTGTLSYPPTQSYLRPDFDPAEPTKLYLNWSASDTTAMSGDRASGLFSCQLQVATSNYLKVNENNFDDPANFSPFAEFSTLSEDCDSLTNYGSDGLPYILPFDQRAKFQLLLTDQASNMTTIIMDTAGNSGPMAKDQNSIQPGEIDPTHQALIRTGITPSFSNLTKVSFSQKQTASYANPNLHSYTENTVINITGQIIDPDIEEERTVCIDWQGTFSSSPAALLNRCQTFDDNSPHEPALLNQGFNFSYSAAELLTALNNGQPLDQLSPTQLADLLSDLPLQLTGFQVKITDQVQDQVLALTALPYTGTIKLTTPPSVVANEEVAVLYDSTLTRFAGTLYFPKNSVPSVKDDVSGLIIPQTASSAQTETFYCHQETGCVDLNLGNDSSQSAQIWYKDINAKAYPFLVQFYSSPTEVDELKIDEGRL